MKIITKNITVDFPFDNYCNLMIDVVPKDDIVGICEIRFVNSFSNSKTGNEALGCYLQGRNWRDASIEIHVPNMLKQMIPEFNFKKYP